MAQASQGVWVKAFRSFLDSLRPRKLTGNLIGKDHLGNKYYEIPADPSIGKRNANRWFQPTVKEQFDQEVPAEWEAWLRGRRKEPPAEDELLKNAAIMHLKKENAKKIDAKWSSLKEPQEKPVLGPSQEKSQFPEYKDYEQAPKR